MSDIRAELQAVIDKSLPSLEAQRLRTYIEEAERAKVSLATATTKAEADAKVIASLRADVTTRDATIQKQADALKDYAARESAFKTSEDAVTSANHRADKADGMRQSAMDVVALFTKNPEIRREHWSSRTTPILTTPMPGSSPYPTGSSINESGSDGSTTRTE